MVNKFVNDSGKEEEKINIVRYEGSQNIRQMKDKGKFIEGFVHIQLGIERILWNKIVELFKEEKAMIVRKNIDESKDITRTTELTKWGYYLGAIDKSEYSDLKDFNKKRNYLLHRHGNWWNSKQYKEALEKGIKFLEKNNM